MTTAEQKKHLLSDLYPYDIRGRKNGDLRKGLKEYNFFLKALAEASHHFQSGNLERFDALVGENACQIRAIKIAILASKDGVGFEDLDPQIAAAESRLATLLEDRKLADLMIKDITLDEILNDERLQISLTSQQLFIYKSFLLTEMKEEECPQGSFCFMEIKDRPTPKKLQRISPDISIKFAHKLGNKFRIKLAELSVNYVRKIAKERADQSLADRLSEDVAFDHNGLPCTPTFWTFKTLIEAALKESIPIVLHAQFLKKHERGYEIFKEEIICFEPKNNGNTTRYTEQLLEKIPENKPACVVQGTVCLPENLSDFCSASWKRKITESSINNIILSCAASHRQYPNPLIEAPFLGDEYFYYKNKADFEGFSFNNQTTFFMNHVFPMLTGRANNLIKT